VQGFAPASRGETPVKGGPLVLASVSLRARQPRADRSQLPLACMPRWSPQFALFDPVKRRCRHMCYLATSPL